MFAVTPATLLAWHARNLAITPGEWLARRHLPMPTTVRLLQVRVEPERGWLLQRR
jgi:hypothetical protein